MSARIANIVLVGGGLAGASAAETLRIKGFDGHITIVGEERHRPYERPPLSKRVLTGDAPPESAFVHPEGFYEEQGIRLVTGDAVTDIDRAAGTLTTRSGATLPFDRLLLATGAAPRTLSPAESPRRRASGTAELEGVLTLRTLDDAQRLHERVRAAGHVTVVGAGWIGCEVAAAARTLGAEVTMVDPLETPLQRVLGPEVGAVFTGLHRDHGVELRLGVGVSSIEGGRRVERVALSDGSAVATDLVVVGIGVVPRTEVAERAGLSVANGIVLDATLTSSDPRILAAGDVANAWHPRYGTHVRVEHWANALNQGRVAAANLLGNTLHYDRLPYFYSDQYDLGLEYVGYATEWDTVVFRGDVAARQFIAFWVRHDRVVAAMNVNVWDVVEDLKRLISAGMPVDSERLVDLDTPLAALADAAEQGRQAAPVGG